MALRRKKSGKRLTLAFGSPCVTCSFLRCQEKLSFVFRSGERKLKTIWVHLVKGVKLGNSRQWNYIASFSGKTGSALIYGLKLIGVRPPPSSSPKRQVLLALLKLPRDCKIWKWVRKDECNSSLCYVLHTHSRKSYHRLSCLLLHGKVGRKKMRGEYKWKRMTQSTYN